MTFIESVKKDDALLCPTALVILTCPMTPVSAFTVGTECLTLITICI